MRKSNLNIRMCLFIAKVNLGDDMEEEKVSFCTVEVAQMEKSMH